jgi:integrase
MPATAGSRIPDLCLHRATGQAVVRLVNSRGRRRDYYLGKFGSEESQLAYQKLVADWIQRGRELPEPTTRLPAAILVRLRELVDTYVAHAKSYYRNADGELSGEAASIERACKFLKDRFGDLDPVQFTPNRLRELRDGLIQFRYGEKTDKKTGALIEGSGKLLSRKYINGVVARIKRMFKWAESRELVPAATYHRLATVEQLQAGRCGVREAPGLGPVSKKDVDATVKLLTPQIGALVRFAWLTGCRMGEAVQLCTRSIDMGGALWLFRPEQHKNRHREKPRVIYIGEEAQEVLRPFVQLDPDRRWFRPCDTMDALNLERRRNRQTRRWPSHMAAQEAKRKTDPKWVPGQEYSTLEVARSIRRACERGKIAVWSPHRLRHSALSRIRKELGIETAAAVAGHSTLSITERYSIAAREALAVEAMRKLG